MPADQPAEPSHRSTTWPLASSSAATPSREALRAARARVAFDDPPPTGRLRGRSRRSQLALVAAEIRELGGAHHRRFTRS